MYISHCSHAGRIFCEVSISSEGIHAIWLAVLYLVVFLFFCLVYCLCNLKKKFPLCWPFVVIFYLLQTSFPKHVKLVLKRALNKIFTANCPSPLLSNSWAFLLLRLCLLLILMWDHLNFSQTWEVYCWFCFIG